MSHRVPCALIIAGVLALFAGNHSASAGCPTCDRRPAPPPAVHRCPTCGQWFPATPGQWSPATGWYPPAPAPSYGYYHPSFPYAYPGYQSPWVTNRQMSQSPAPPPAGGLVPAPTPDPNFNSHISYPPYGYDGFPRPTYGYDPVIYGRIADSPWIRERRRSCYDDWDDAPRYPSAATVWQSYY